MEGGRVEYTYSKYLTTFLTPYSSSGELKAACIMLLSSFYADNNYAREVILREMLTGPKSPSERHSSEPAPNPLPTTLALELGINAYLECKVICYLEVYGHRRQGMR